MSRMVRGCILGLLCIVLTLSFNTAYARDFYNFEASTGFLNRENDNYEMRDYGLIATSYFKKIVVGDHPWAEAAFMERASSITIPAGITQFESGGLEGDGPVYGLDVTYIHPGIRSGRPIYTNASFSTTNVEIDSTNNEFSINEYNLGIGMFFRDDLLVAFGYGHEKEEFKDAVLGTYEVKNNLYAVSTKWVQEKSNGRALNVQASLGLDQYDDGIDDGSNTILKASGDYYFNPRMSVGAGLTLNTGDYLNDEGSTFEIRSAIFFNPRFSVRAGFEQFIADNDSSEDTQIINFNLSTRF